jgi:hypothetical protein
LVGNASDQFRTRAEVAGGYPKITFNHANGRRRRLSRPADHARLTRITWNLVVVVIAKFILMFDLSQLLPVLMDTRLS